jgi:hypothetical protein
MGVGDNPYMELDIRHKLFMDTTKNALLFSPTALASRAAAEALMVRNFNVNGTGYFVGILQTNGGIQGKITTVTNTYTILTSDETIVCNKSTAFTVTLPTATVGQRFNIKNIGAGTVTIEGDSSDTIDGDLNQAIYQWEGVQVICIATNTWSVL